MFVCMYVCMYVCIWTSTIQAFAFIGIPEQGMTSPVSCASTEDARQAGRYGCQEALWKAYTMIKMTIEYLYGNLFDFESKVQWLPGRNFY